VTASARPLRVGVVGSGWAGATHVASYAGLPDVQVVALAGEETGRTVEVARKHGVPAVFGTWQQLLEEPGLDAISVCAPNALHHPIAMAALRAGIHVLCEKPLALDSVQAGEMVAAAMRADRVLMTVFNLRKRRAVAALRAAVRDGSLGHVYYAKASWLRRRHEGPGGWSARRTTAGGGAFIDLGIHVLDLALHLLGEPEVRRASGAIHAELASGWLTGVDADAGTWDVEDLGVGLLRLAGGTTVVVEASWALHGPGAEDEVGILLHGVGGGARLILADPPTADELQLFDGVAGTLTEAVPEAGPVDGHVEVVSEFVRVIRDGDWTQHRGQAGLNRARLIDALYQSAKLGAEVAVSPLPLPCSGDST
jgi:predicted dehydrogenase